MSLRLNLYGACASLLAALWLGACSEASTPPIQRSNDENVTGDGDSEESDGDGDSSEDPDSEGDGDSEPDTDRDASSDPDDGDPDENEDDAGTSGGGRLPSSDDLKKPGPFTPTTSSGPSGYVLFHPKELGKDDVKHPVVVWGPGAAENAGIFATLLNHLASHGFAVISYDSTPDGVELTKAVDWMIAENARSGSTFYKKLDTQHIAVGGHSAGSIATFKVGADKRLTTTLHISGGTFDPHTDIQNLHAPALFICGEPPVDGLLVGDVARPNCDIDFENAEIPVFYGVTKGASHMTPTDIGDATLRSYQLAAMVGWLRWQLAGDTSSKAMFAGPSCTLCSDANWTSEQKGLK